MAWTALMTLTEYNANSSNYFTIESLANGNEIQINGTFSSGTATIYCSLDNGETWDTYDNTKVSSANAIVLNSNDTLLVRCNCNSLYGKTLSSTKNIKVEGNILSLIWGENFSSKDELNGTRENVFREFFKGCRNLKDASNLYIPAFSGHALPNSTFLSLFEGCTGLIHCPAYLLPVLPGISCYRYMFKGCTNMEDTPNCMAQSIGTYGFSFMFENCNSIIDPMPIDDLISHSFTFTSGLEMYGMYKNCNNLTSTYTSLPFGFTPYCYTEMYYGCSSITAPSSFNISGFTPVYSSNCCARMYLDCRSLISIAAMNASWNANNETTNHFNGMYLGCTGLTTISLSFGRLGDSSCENMFYGCTGLTISSLSFGSITNNTCRSMFEGCTTLNSINLSISSASTTASTITFIVDSEGGETLSIPFHNGGCYCMFKGCTGLLTINNTISLPTGLSLLLCECMFEGCYNLTSAKIDLAFLESAAGACISMFLGCSNLTEFTGTFSGKLGDCACMYMFKNSNIDDPSFTLYLDESYHSSCANMFEGCTALTTIEHLTFDSNTKFGENSLSYMFKGCTSLTNFGEKTFDLNDKLYAARHMFDGCTALTELNLILENVGIKGAYSMFENTSINSVTLSITNISDYGCALMFLHSTGLQTLNITTLKNIGDHGCYHMFYQCSSLATASLSVDTIGLYGCLEMFESDGALTSVTFTKLEDIGNNGCDSMFINCGELQSLTVASIKNVGQSGCASMFSGCAKLGAITTNINSVGKDGCKLMFNGCTKIPSVLLTIDVVYENGCELMFNGCTSMNNCNLTIGTDNNETNIIYDNGCKQMFLGCTNLRTATLNLYNIGTQGCNSMFNGCSELSTATGNLKNIDVEGCNEMFKSCSKLANISNLKLLSPFKSGACKQMFLDCTSLTTYPLNLFTQNSYIDNVYNAMFKGCTKLSTIPTINSSIERVFDEYCFNSMFEGCTGIKDIELDLLGQFKKGCFSNMFKDCLHPTIDNTFSLICIKSNYDIGEAAFSSMFENSAVKAKANSDIVFDFESVSGPTTTKTFGDSAFSKMFYKCNNLTQVPIFITPITFNADNENLINTIFGERCFSETFTDCHNLNNTTKGTYSSYIDIDKSFAANQFSKYCFYRTFYNCKELEYPVKFIGHKIIFLNNACQEMYSVGTCNQTSGITHVSKLKETVNIDAKSLDKSALQDMYKNCTAITKSGSITTETLQENALNGLYKNCTNLTLVGDITANSAGNNALKETFMGCTAIETMPNLYIKDYNDYTCYGTFKDCTNLQNIGTSLSTAEKVGNYTFYEMFMNCTSLVDLSESVLPGGYVLYKILVDADLALTSPKMKKYSYLDSQNKEHNHFLNSDTLYYTLKKVGNSITLAKANGNNEIIYQYTFAKMFYGCTNLTLGPVAMNQFNALGKYCFYLMFANTGIITSPILTHVKYEKCTAPKIDEDGYIILDGTNVLYENGAFAETVNSTEENPDYIYKKSSDISDIIGSAPEGAFAGMFMNSGIRNVPNLQITKFGVNSANSMFMNCKNLGTATATFTASEADDYAFSNMFANCPNFDFNNLNMSVNYGDMITEFLPNLSKVGKYTFAGMFANCTNLHRALKLTVSDENAEIPEGCFSSMYLNCVSLGNYTGGGTLTLSFTNNNNVTRTMAKSSCMNMFRNCINIKNVTINANYLKASCFENMFMDCNALTTATVEFTDIYNPQNQRHSLRRMFYKCHSLRTLYCTLQLPFSRNVTHDWLYDVGDNGTYYCHNALKKSLVIPGYTSIPEDWDMIAQYI